MLFADRMRCPFPCFEEFLVNGKRVGTASWCNPRCAFDKEILLSGRRVWTLKLEESKSKEAVTGADHHSTCIPKVLYSDRRRNEGFYLHTEKQEAIVLWEMFSFIKSFHVA